MTGDGNPAVLRFDASRPSCYLSATRRAPGIPTSGELTGHAGWELVVAMREATLKALPEAPTRLIGALQEVATFLRTHLEDADRIAVQTVQLPPGVLTEAVRSQRWEVDVRPAWGPERQQLWDMFQRAVDAKLQEAMPDAGILYAP